MVVLTGKPLEWSEVAARHGTYAGVAIRDGRVCSLLCGHAGHGDSIEDQSVRYRIPRRTGYQRPLKALHSAAEDKHTFTVFRKISVNVWEELGSYSISQVIEGETDVVFVLAQSVEDECAEAEQDSLSSMQ